MSRRDRRNNDPAILQKRELFANIGNAIGSPIPTSSSQPVGARDAGGLGNNAPGAKPAGGQTPYVNPFMIPKAAGINVTSQTYLPNYYVEWNLSTWRAACDQAIKMGYTASYATLVSWAYECSPFIRSLFTKLGDALDKVQFFAVDMKGNRMDDWTAELCLKPWHIQLRREILYSFFWGFSGLNFDPSQGKVYKYPMQDIDPINRLLKANTYSFYDGTRFAENDNLLFVQPSTSYEEFLGWMQAITRSFIMMNQSKNNWLSAGRRLAFPLLTVGYPQNDGEIDGLGNPLNQFKVQAEDIAANIDPSKGLVYPYTINAKGEIQKSVEVEFESPKSGQNMHKIFSEFNNDEKNEIREMIFGGTLSSSNSSGGSGSRALGEVHERMLQAVVESKIDYVLSVLNFDFAPKISKWYTNIPDGWRFDINRTKKLTIEEMTEMATVLTASGKRFTDEFFETSGLSKEFFEDAPAPVAPAAKLKPVPDPEDDPELEMARPTRSIFGGVKKK